MEEQISKILGDYLIVVKFKNGGEVSYGEAVKQLSKLFTSQREAELKEIHQAIDQEIDWCKHHKPTNTETDQVSFIEGLIQANRIISKLSEKE